MQVKCLRVLQYFPPPEDPATSRLLNATLKRIITGSDVAKNINKNNAQHAIVFEAIGLALALDADPDLLNAGDFLFILLWTSGRHSHTSHLLQLALPHSHL